MGILERFRSSKQPPTKPRGGSGRAHHDGFLQFEEHNADLTFPRGLRVFDKMYRTDPDVRRVVWMVCNPIVGATWTVEPFGGDDAEERDVEAAKAVEWALFTNMRPRFKGHLAQALPIGVRSGFAPFEEIWETTDWNGRKLITPRTLDLRLPRSIHRFIQDGPELEKLEQMLPTGGLVKLPIEDLLYYRFGAEGDNWEGTSLLRAAYKPWYLKDKLERIDVIKAERQAIGVPICYPPANVKAEQLEEMEEILGGVRAAEQGFIIAPGPHAQDLKELAESKGWRIEILGVGDGESTVDIKPSLEYHSDKIAAAFIAEFMRLGQGSQSVGARATADVQQNPFLSAVESLASEVESALQPLVNRITALNFDVDEPPRLCMSLVDSTSLTELAEYAQKLATAGALHPDNDLEDWFRDRADLPPADPEAREERKTQAEETRQHEAEAAKAALQQPPQPKPGDPNPRPQPEPSPPPKPKDEPEDQPDAGERREMRWWEELMALDEIEASIDSARERFEAAAGGDARRVAGEMASAILAGRTVQPKPDAELQKAVYGELARLYRTGRATVIDELEAQRPGAGDRSAAADAESEARKRLLNRAKLASAAVGNRIWQAISHSVLNRPRDKAAAQAAGEAEAAAALRGEAQLHAAGALNEGRQDEADAHAEEIAGARYTSILDRRRCDQCALADDDVLRPLGDPVREARRPPNRDCYGGGRCRCMEFYELTDEDPGYGGAPAPPEPTLTPPEGPGGLAEDYLDVSGGSPEMRNLIADQLAAIDQVHRFPKSMPRIPLQIRPNLQSGGRDAFGSFGGEMDLGGNWHDERIRLSAKALRRRPPITSAVHEVGHFLDAHGFGDGTPVEAILKGGFETLYSSTPAMREWREAVTTSEAYKRLVMGGTAYQHSTSELLARSYEQYIATRSGNAALRAKIDQRLGEEADMYWSETDFEPIAEAFDRFFATRGLR